jgi:hypothetical protein
MLQGSGAAQGPGDEGIADREVGVADELRQQRRVCVGVCLLLQFKRFLMDAYQIKASALLDFATGSSRCAERCPALKNIPLK